MLAGTTRGVVGRAKVGMRFSGYLCWEIVWIEGEVVMAFILNWPHKWSGCCQGVLHDTDRLAFLKMELMGLDVITITHVDWCPFLHFESIQPISPMSMSCTDALAFLPPI